MYDSNKNAKLSLEIRISRHIVQTYNIWSVNISENYFGNLSIFPLEFSNVSSKKLNSGNGSLLGHCSPDNNTVNNNSLNSSFFFLSQTDHTLGSFAP